MRQHNALDQMSDDIKCCELFLKDFPITNDVAFRTTGEAVLVWDCSTKRIAYNTGSILKNLIELPLVHRMIAYDHLPNFIQFCIDEEEKKIKRDDLRAKHNELKSVLAKYGTVI